MSQSAIAILCFVTPSMIWACISLQRIAQACERIASQDRRP